MKFIFVIDRSASNCRRVPEGSAIGTDPQGVRRFLPIRNFLQNYAAVNPNNSANSTPVEATKERITTNAARRTVPPLFK